MFSSEMVTFAPRMHDLAPCTINHQLIFMTLHLQVDSRPVIPSFLSVCAEPPTAHQAEFPVAAVSALLQHPCEPILVGSG